MLNANQKRNHQICIAEKAIKHKITIQSTVIIEIHLDFGRKLLLCFFILFFILFSPKIKQNKNENENNSIYMICQAIYGTVKPFE